MKTQLTSDRLAPRPNNFHHVFRQLACALLLAASLPGVPALGSPGGELDPAFGDRGRILLREAPFEEFAGVDVFVDPGNGNLLVVADGYHGDRLLRINSDGSLDQSFGNQGTALLDLGNDNLSIADVEWLADGSLLIAGALNVHGDPANVIHGSAFLARMHADGTRDESFGNGGRAALQLGGRYESISEILLQADGRIVVFGSTDRTGSTERILAQYTQDGLPDSSFGFGVTPGVSVVDFAGIAVGLTAIVQQSDAKFLACGYVTSRNGASASNAIVAIRFLPSGAPDSTFGNNGMVLIGGWPDSVKINTCMELADGHFIFAGIAGSDERQRAAVWRITHDGHADASFGANGMAILDTETRSSATAMTVMTDGGLAIAGTRWAPESQWNPDDYGWSLWADMLVARIDPTSGQVDQGFGNQGVTAIDFGTGEYTSRAVASSLTQQPDGKLVIVGSQVDLYDWYGAYSIALSRVDPYGSGSNGWVSLTDSYAFLPTEGGEVALQLRRTGGSTGQLTVDYRTVADTASAGTDFVATSGTVTWSDGDMSDKTISVTVLSAALAESTVVFNVELFNASGGLAFDQATIVIDRRHSSSGTSSTGGGVRINGGGGGGAIGIELWFLMVLTIVGVALRSRPLV
jgi:uncharacterized delta-60 repeat protein